MKPRSYPFFILAAAELFLPSQSHAADVFLSSAAIGSGDNDANVGVGIHTQQWRELEHL